MTPAGMKALARLHQSRNDREREDEVSIAKALQEQHPAEFPSWGAAIKAAAEVVRAKRRA